MAASEPTVPLSEDTDSLVSLSVHLETLTLVRVVPLSGVELTPTTLTLAFAGDDRFGV